MITYIQTIKDTKTHVCTKEKWEEMVKSRQTAEYIKQFRKTKNIDWKQRLPAVNFHGYDPKVLKGLDGSRKQSDMMPTGLFMLDVDHVKDPKLLFEQLKQKMGGALPSTHQQPQEPDNNEQPQEPDNSADGALRATHLPELALVHITPSGEGLRIVMKGREGSNIIDDQAALAAVLEVKHDVCTKDLSRWSFVPMEEDIFLYEPQILFADAQETTYNKTKEPLSGGMDGSTNPVSKNVVQATLDFNSGFQGGLDPPSGNFPETLRGIPYSKIVDALIQYRGGIPEQGERHATLIYLANQLKTVCDNNVDWLMEIIPCLGKPRSEKREAIVWAIQHQAAEQGKALRTVLNRLLIGEEITPSDNDDADAHIEEEEQKKQEALASMPRLPKKLPKLLQLLTSKVMPFQRPAVAQMVFPPLAAHIADAIFINNENKKFELSLMGVLVGKQSVGKGCIDAPVDCIIDSILMEDEQAREELRAWAESQQNKKANEKGSQRPEKPIRILNTDTTPAALLANLYNAQHNGYAKNLCCFTKSEEIEEMYDMSPTAGRSKISQLIKKTYDRGRIGSERFTSSAANYTTVLRWNWITACTPDKAKAFFKRALTDGTLSRVDFATIIPTEDNVKFVYGDYDETFEDALEPYIENLRKFRCERDKKGRLKPFRLEQLSRIEDEMDDYIREYSKTMPDDTWRNYAWRTKLNALKKILVLYIANGGEWEDSFEEFCWWSFNYGMWVKMNLFYMQARDAFDGESLLAGISIKSPLELLNSKFSRQEFYNACKQCGYTSKPRMLLHKYKDKGKIKDTDQKDIFELVLA